MKLLLILLSLVTWVSCNPLVSEAKADGELPVVDRADLTDMQARNAMAVPYGQSLRSGNTSDFYPFGPSAGDSANPKRDDGGSSQLSVSLSAGFRFFGSVYHNFWVNNNGLVSFEGQVSQFTPSPFPIQSFPTVAVFWSDIDNRLAGEVYWRQTTSDQSLISRVSQDILRNYPDIPSFQARWVLVTTYYDVTYFGGSPTTNRQSFQAVLATDGTYSFAIFKYGDIVWTTGTSSQGDHDTGLGGIPAQAGFNAGDGTNYYTVPGSRSAEIVQIETRTNVGQPGTFMFRIDPFTIIPLGTVRLVGGSSVFEGRVEINRGGAWGTICDDNWGIEEAQVVCREIGHGGAVAAFGSAHFGQGSGTIWLNNVDCAGNEDSLSTCPLLSDVTNTCTHADDAGVQCRDLDNCRPDPCQNGGTCLDKEDDFVCLCLHPYEGKTCDINTANPCQSGPCENGGVCSSSGGSFTCSCQPGWQGTICQINTSPPDPSSTPVTVIIGSYISGMMCDGWTFFLVENDCSSIYYVCSPGHDAPILFNCPANLVFNKDLGVCDWPDHVPYCSCQSGLAGASCQINLDDCSPNPCQNGGLCQDLVGDFVCHCLPSYQGKTCETFVDPCNSGPCQHGGVCSVSGNKVTCSCQPGWNGDFCEMNIDECSSNPCQNGGVCQDLVADFSCNCPAPYEGKMCEIYVNPCGSGPCQNGGVCSASGATFTCSCQPGWNGATCGIDIDECSPNPCQNGGVCQDLVADFSCTCPPPYEGKMCEIYVNPCDSGPCQNGGVCSASGATFTCSCQPGWNGATCGTNVDECSPNPCQNGGVCQDLVADFSCSCPAPYEGKMCEIYVDPCGSGPCQNGGVCSASGATFTCSCQPGWNGATCGINIDECNPNPCQNGGVCQDLVADFSCSCPTPYEGKMCETYVSPCSSGPCQNGGVCSATGATFTCSCQPGWNGATCGTNLDECSPNLCQNGGVCQDLVADFSCSCPPLYEGKTCEIYVSTPPPYIPTTAPVITEGAVVPFSPGLTCNGLNFFLLDSDCSNIYYVCSPGHDAPILMYCPATLVFNKDIRVCDNPLAVVYC